MTLDEATTALGAVLGLVIAPMVALMLGYGWIVVCLAAPVGVIAGVLLGGGASRVLVVYAHRLYQREREALKAAEKSPDEPEPE